MHRTLVELDGHVTLGNGVEVPEAALGYGSASLVANLAFMDAQFVQEWVTVQHVVVSRV